jgi:queuine tRNA-ribosyltransferase
MSFTVIKNDAGSLARTGVLKTARGEIRTPVFMPVGTRGALKALTHEHVEALGAEIILCNTYHMLLKPGMDIIGKAGGLHKFISWEKPILTDSGGFQIFSLASLRKIRPEGVEFASHIDGSRFMLGPVESLRTQRTLGSDIVMAFDECTPYPCSREDAEKSLNITLEWEKISRDQPLEPHQKLFGIVQGSVYKELRLRSAEELAKIGFEGYAVGGLSVGEPEESMYECLDWVIPALPQDAPHYLMGVGTPAQIVEAVARGVDMFDCVLPTRLARHGSAFVSGGGTIHVKAGANKEDFTPVDPGCSCPVCKRHSKAYIRHLLNVGEMLGATLLSIHNIHYFMTLMRGIRAALEDGTFSEFRKKFASAP